MSTYPRKIRLTVHMVNGDVLSSVPFPIENEKEEGHWAALLRKPKEMAYLSIAQAAALGGEDTIYINPTHVAYIVVTDIVE